VVSVTGWLPNKEIGSFVLGKLSQKRRWRARTGKEVRRSGFYALKSNESRRCCARGGTIWRVYVVTRGVNEDLFQFCGIFDSQESERELFISTQSSIHERLSLFVLTHADQQQGVNVHLCTGNPR
jgi:hypothetical protein